MTTTVQVVPLPFKVAVQVPPVPGYDPPLNVNGADRFPPFMPDAVKVPVFVMVKALSSVAPVASVPKS